jgi:lipid-binding SYLF domain-containing protein
LVSSIRKCLGVKAVMVYIARLGRFACGRIWYGGISLDGAVVATWDPLNKADYGKEVTPTHVLIRRAVTNTQSAGPLAPIAKVAGGE